MEICGEVVRGRGLGHTIGFPTANVLLEGSDVAVADGVYMSRVELDGVFYNSISNLGCNPSVGGVSRRLETYIFDFEGDLYGRILRVELLRKIRDEKKFDSLDELVQQIEIDRDEVLKLIK